MQVDHITCPVLLMFGDDDQSCHIQQIMEKAGNRHLLQVHIYPGAGHLIEPPYSPHHRAANFKQGKNKAKPHADAQEDSWEKPLAFLQQHLYHATPQAKL
ncbi:hypothetical protein P4O66_014449 [Electrophorus voltai]|uniref:BAAT/Acyl-CoA thioester hydrolase C-terminal domain-containing protein n=1 Tax=Electrophorus voltai TaxID=2609070 RepID=A0AAD9DSY8_9TELE|nr:hypothetical protein P4O66_014449 [Electrophorus voltai]